jgi:Domain of unknown function (DUF1905)/Bacteriocin-protection, YdeI or OmpD-Associated
MADVTLKTTILATGNNTGIEVPPETIEKLGAGKRPTVTARIGDYSWTVMIGVMGGRHLIPFAKEKREATGLGGGDEVTLHLSVLTEPRVLEIPAELRTALDEAGVSPAFDALSFTLRKEAARSVTGAKADATRERRIAKVIDGLRG